MQADLTVIEVIGLAIRSEEDAAAFYAHLAKQINNVLVKAKFLDLAREESGHRKILVDMLAKLTGSKKAPLKIPGNPETAEGGGVPFSTTDIEELLKIAIGREQKANAFYKDASRSALDVNSKRTLEYLATIEYGHEQLLNAELEAYLRDRNWYADNPDVQLVGP